MAQLPRGTVLRVLTKPSPFSVSCALAELLVGRVDGHGEGALAGEKGCGRIHRVVCAAGSA